MIIPGEPPREFASAAFSGLWFFARKHQLVVLIAGLTAGLTAVIQIAPKRELVFLYFSQKF